ncbi:MULTISPECIES: hypothetical protein [unclassified Campylobacter]|uniref:hypothetical protein n=1 Tax=unclassified Campylobacter TaxID=2593542 RepID=UPI0014736F02|nr:MULTISPECIES: hypothetical protein [unclassified Campylobacter]
MDFNLKLFHLLEAEKIENSKIGEQITLDASRLDIDSFPRLTKRGCISEITDIFINNSKYCELTTFLNKIPQDQHYVALYEIRRIIESFLDGYLDVKTNFRNILKDEIKELSNRQKQILDLIEYLKDERISLFFQIDNAQKFTVKYNKLNIDCLIRELELVNSLMQIQLDRNIVSSKVMIEHQDINTITKYYQLELFNFCEKYCLAKTSMKKYFLSALKNSVDIFLNSK